VPAGLIGRALLAAAPDAAAWLLWFAHDRADLDTWSWILAVGLMMTQVPLRFPTGLLPSPAWRWYSWSTIAAILLAAVVQSTYTAEEYPGLPSPVHVPVIVGPIAGQFIASSLLIMWSFVGSLASLVWRYRRSGAAERAQIRWMAWSVSLVGVALTIDAFVLPELRILHEWILAAFALVPLSIAIAVLRYRLFEIDRIISRTASYAIVSLLVVAVYAVIVTSVTWLLPGAPAVAVALATLAAAALFLPALRWIQHRVDRRFDRARYDALRIVEEFGERLRSGANPHTVATELFSSVDKALQPTSMGLWTKDGGS
jgi:hypothetical protein